MKQNKLVKLRNYIVFLLLLVCIPFMNANAAWKEYEADYSNGKETKRIHCEMWPDVSGYEYSERIGYSCYIVNSDGTSGVALGGTSITEDYLKNGVISSLFVVDGGYATLDGGWGVVDGTINGISSFTPFTCYYQGNNGEEITIELTSNGTITSSKTDLLSRQQTKTWFVDDQYGVGYLYNNHLSKTNCPTYLMTGKSTKLGTDTFKFGDNENVLKDTLKKDDLSVYTLNGTKTSEAAEAEYIEAKNELNTCIHDKVDSNDQCFNSDSSSYDESCLEKLDTNYKAVCSEQIQNQEEKKEALENYKSSSSDDNDGLNIVIGNFTCESLSDITAWVGKLYRYGIVFLFVAMVILTMSDFTKATVSGKNEDEIKKAGKHVVTRIIIIVIYIVLPQLITAVLGNLLNIESCLNF